MTGGPRTRLTAEMIRDQALAVSGLLSSKMYGPPVMPPQPEGIWRSAYNSAKWETSKGEDRYRRALYTYCKRTSGYPSFQMFDATSREICTARRITTSTPLQALVTLNDPVYVECAQALATRMIAGTDDTPADVRAVDKAALVRKIAYGWQTALGRKPAQADLDDLIRLYGSTLDRYQHDAGKAAKLGTSPEEAALAVVANAILNIDAFLTK
jgi:hypothetical protein